ATTQNVQEQQKKPPTETPPEIQPVIKQQVTVNPAAEKIFYTGKTAFDTKDIITARDQLSQALNLGLQNNLDQIAREMLNQSADLWLFSRTSFPRDTFCTRHTVESGQYLSTIARKYSIPHELISRINGISDPSKLKAGQAIKVVQGPFHAKVELSKFSLTVYIDKTVVKTYNISIGKPDRETPTGLWEVELKQPNPTWTDPDTGKVYRPDDPGNPLGTRWIALKGLEGDAVGRTGIGIHGTIKPGEIGQQASRGCIRLFNGEVQELYDLMVPGKSQIWVVE
ncbi:MAG: L,D-transpeptidase family protein, partial [Planctomycetes bacterium]|nr:L,D-transpeptidase family protein [Planctomycetota bacterium]